MMFVYHYVIIPFHTQYLSRHAPQGGGAKEEGAVSQNYPLSSNAPIVDVVCGILSTYISYIN